MAWKKHGWSGWDGETYIHYAPEQTPWGLSQQGTQESEATIRQQKLMEYSPVVYQPTKKRPFLVQPKRRVKARRGNQRHFNVETKFFDVILDDGLVDSAGTVTNSLLLIAQGLTAITRIGRRIIVRSLHWHINLTLGNQTDPTKTSDVVRIILYVDRQANGATIAVLDFLESATFLSFRNLSNSKRFRVLMDKSFIMQASAFAGNGTANDSGRVVKQHHFNTRLNLKVEYSAGGGAITELESNNIGVLAISEAGLTTLTSKIRVRFTD